MKIVVLGAGGQLGQVVTDAAVARGHDVTSWTRAEANITDAHQLTSQLHAAAPDAIFNCAAWASVDDAEDSPSAVLAVNALAVRTLARVANAINAVLVHYSTDFVFDGRTPGPNTEDREPNPSGVYAVSKLLGEWMAADAARHYILRVESLFGGRAAKSSVDVMLQRVADGAEIRAFADRTVTPSYVVDVAEASLDLVERQVTPGIYHCVNSGVTTWLELAHEVARLAGRPDAAIVPVNMAELTMRVPRPLNAAMDNAKLARVGITMPDWRDALSRYVAHRLRPSQQ
jgi:dTDP-4-dehydrorhamnose reductase